jgi:two-component system, OmpR family, alkaline phosphatase synthesis response regulator PhoP
MAKLQSKPRKSRILIADDNAPNVELMEAFLADVDCDIAVAVDGRDTLDKVASFLPDLILLDVMMPKMSGFEVCRKLKQDPATKDILILMVTALNELGDIERAVDAGTDDFLSKPVNKLELLKRLEVMLRLHHVTDELERLRRYIQEMEDEAGPDEGQHGKDDQDESDDAPQGPNKPRR